MHGMVDVMGMMLITVSHDQKAQVESSKPEVDTLDE
jgi:hypothetical protein